MYQSQIIHIMDNIIDCPDVKRKLSFIINTVKDPSDRVILIKSLNNKPDIFEDDLCIQNCCVRGLSSIVKQIKLEIDYEFFNYLDISIISKLINSLLEEYKTKLEDDELVFLKNNIEFLLNIFINKFDGKKYKLYLCNNKEDVFILKFIINFLDNRKLYNNVLYNNYFINNYKEEFLELCNPKEILGFYTPKNIYYRYKNRRR